MDLRSYYLTKMKGKTKAARIIDLVFFRLLFFLALYVFFLYRTHLISVALLMSLSLVTAFTVLSATYNRYKLNVFIEKFQNKLKAQCVLEKISRMPKTQFDILVNHLLDDMGYTCQKAGEGYIDSAQNAYIAVLKRYPQINSTLQDLTDICAVAAEYSLDRCFVFSTTEFDKQAHDLINRIHWPEIKLFPVSEILKVYEKYCDMPSDEELLKIIQNEISGQQTFREKIKHNIFKTSNILKYIICAAVIYFAGLIIPAMRVYYIAFASCAMCFALISAYLSSSRSKSA